MPDNSKKDCFVVGPIGAADSTVRIHADWLLEEIVTPVMDEYPDFIVHRADKLSQPGLIDTQVITHLLNDDLVIADITTLNPNAFYEIGIRHMVQKPIIHVHKVGEKIPFDISAYRSIQFSLERPTDLREARENLKSAIKSVLTEGYRVDNPVTHARGVVQVREDVSSPQRVLLDELAAIKDRLNKVERESGASQVPSLQDMLASPKGRFEHSAIPGESSDFAALSTDEIRNLVTRLAAITDNRKDLSTVIAWLMKDTGK